VQAGDYHIHLSVDPVDDVFELGYVPQQRVDIGKLAGQLCEAFLERRLNASTRIGRPPTVDGTFP
jgi:hypothetical protein